ncbi:PTS system N-acetylgalactosamine-specific IIA component [Alkalibaculum bacchi]|uniref:PTS system N-acetylgalactosamine-specific IIA component n=1 Tax=Alkalibaculum bacchi TaxID=645887 RepID=A0A366I551_9FIRM|nr:PTS fructose transporter subunit IIA [Alkalibaculum bacchi]RBP63340.1 PTS system N-acetylgalactosamine-specific IIA component [Alkalibaculum bacchi]
MNYVVLVSHGIFAQGVHSVLDMLVGSNRNDILSISLKDGMSGDDFYNEFDKVISMLTEEDKVLLLGDIIGGSPLTNAINCLHERKLLDNTVVFGGINVPLALNAALFKDTVSSIEELKEQLISEATGSLKIVTFEDENDDDDI